MPYDEKLAERLRVMLGDRRDLAEQKMFGGIGFMLAGNMCCGVHRDELIVRVSPDKSDDYLADPHARPFDISGRPMRGWLLVSPDGVKSQAALRRWVDRGTRFVVSLPKKPAKKNSTKRK